MIALDTAVRNLVASGVPLVAAVAAASANPAALLGEVDRGHLAVGMRAHLVELDDDLRVLRVTRGRGWVGGPHWVEVTSRMIVQLYTMQSLEEALACVDAGADHLGHHAARRGCRASCRRCRRCATSWTRWGTGRGCVALTVDMDPG